MMRLARSFRALRRRFAADEQGTSILEIALCSPILVTFIVGIVDVAMYASARLQAAQGVYRGLEIVQVNTTLPSDTTISAQVAAAAGHGIDAADVAPAWDIYCDGVKQADATAVCAGGTEQAYYLRVSATGEFTPLLPAMTSRFFSNARSDGVIPFTVAAAVRVQ